MKRLVLLGTTHEVQDSGNALNPDFEQRLLFLVRAFSVTLLMEEWACDRPQSCASRLVHNKISYKNVGTGSDGIFRTFANATVDYPGHDGTLGSRPDAPSIREYGPLTSQENREVRMAQNVQAEMEEHNSGLLIVGLAHLHSMSVKLDAAGFNVAAYSWLPPLRYPITQGA